MQSTKYKVQKVNGVLAHKGRALGLQLRGEQFDSVIFHHVAVMQTNMTIQFKNSSMEK